MKTKSAINKAKKSKVVRKRSSAPKRRWDSKDLKKMVQIVKAAPTPVLGQKEAANHFGVSYAAIQCKWSRYNRGIGMSRINKRVEKINDRVEKVKEKVKAFTEDKPRVFTEYKVYDLPKKEKSTPVAVDTSVLDMITIKSMKVHKDERMIIIHY